MKRCGIARVWAPILLGVAGCVQPASRPEYAEVVQNLRYAAHRPPESVRPEDPDAAVLDPAPTPPDLLGPQPVDAYIRQALRENRTVQAARFNVLALKARIPQVTALDDPIVSNTIYPIPSVAPQYSLMGYNPYNVLHRAAVSLVRHALPPRPGGRKGRRRSPWPSWQPPSSTWSPTSSAAYYDLYFNEQAEQDPGR